MKCVLALATVMAVVACSLDPDDYKSADQLMKDALATLGRARAVHFTGTFAQGGHKYEIDLTVTRDGGAKGTVTEDGLNGELAKSGDRLLLRGQELIKSIDPKLAKLVGDRWLVDTDQSAVKPLAGVIDVPQLQQQLDGRRAGLTRSSTTTVRGTKLAVLSDRAGSLYVTEKGTTEVTRITQRPGTALPDGTTDENVNLAYPSSVDLALPQKDVVDPNDPKTMPARYILDDFKLDSCDTSGCGMKSVVHNKAGAPYGPAAAINFTVTAGPKSLGSCTTPLPALDFDATATVSCRVGGADWSSFVSGGGGAYTGHVQISNPLYD